MICRVRTVYSDGTVLVLPAVGSPADLEQAAYDAGALGVTVVVLP